MKTSRFIFAICQVGAEPALKQELGRQHPELRFAYSRPGFVTFRSESELTPDFRLNSVLARAYGLSFGKLGDKGQSRGQQIESLLHWGREFAREGLVHLHVWERDRFPPGEEPPGFSYSQRKREMGEQIRAAAEAHQSIFPSRIFAEAEIPKPGELVLDVIGIEDNEWWVGLHEHSAAHSPYPGARPELELPEEAPSRAYLKLEEVLLWSGAVLKAGEVALEIGSAPGGACYSLLKRGLSVIGVDPGEMAPVVRAYSRSIVPLGTQLTELRTRPKNWFRHYQLGIADLPIEQIPEKIDWVLLDMNVVPNISLASAERVITHPRVRSGLQGVFLTVKMNRWILIEDVPQMIERVRRMGLSEVRAAQLSTHKQEIVICGFTTKGLGRLPRS